MKDKFNFKKKPGKSLIKLNYKVVRDDFQNGDILLYKGRGLFSSLIKMFTKSQYSHAGIVTWWNDRLMVLEAVGKGVVASTLSKNIKDYIGDIEWYVLDKPVTEEQRLNIVKAAQEELGKEYNKRQVYKIALHMIFKIPFRRYDKEKRSRKLFCSQYVSSVFESIGIDLQDERANEFTSPDDIAKSDKIVQRGILKILKD